MAEDDKLASTTSNVSSAALASSQELPTILDTAPTTEETRSSQVEEQQSEAATELEELLEDLKLSKEESQQQTSSTGTDLDDELSRLTLNVPPSLGTPLLPSTALPPFDAIHPDSQTGSDGPLASSQLDKTVKEPVDTSPLLTEVKKEEEETVEATHRVKEEAVDEPDLVPPTSLFSRDETLAPTKIEEVEDDEEGEEASFGLGEEEEGDSSSQEDTVDAFEDSTSQDDEAEAPSPSPTPAKPKRAVGASTLLLSQEVDEDDKKADVAPVRKGEKEEDAKGGSGAASEPMKEEEEEEHPEDKLKKKMRRGRDALFSRFGRSSSATAEGASPTVAETTIARSPSQSSSASSISTRGGLPSPSITAPPSAPALKKKSVAPPLPLRRAAAAAPPPPPARRSSSTSSSFLPPPPPAPAPAAPSPAPSAASRSRSPTVESVATSPPPPVSRSQSIVSAILEAPHTLSRLLSDRDTSTSPTTTTSRGFVDSDSAPRSSPSLYTPSPALAALQHQAAALPYSRTQSRPAPPPPPSSYSPNQPVSMAPPGGSRHRLFGSTSQVQSAVGAIESFWGRGGGSGQASLGGAAPGYGGPPQSYQSAPAHYSTMSAPGSAPPTSEVMYEPTISTFLHTTTEFVPYPPSADVFNYSAPPASSSISPELAWQPTMHHPSSYGATQTYALPPLPTTYASYDNAGFASPAPRGHAADYYAESAAHYSTINQTPALYSAIDTSQLSTETVMPPQPENDGSWTNYLNSPALVEGPDQLPQPPTEAELAFFSEYGSPQLASSGSSRVPSFPPQRQESLASSFGATPPLDPSISELSPAASSLSAATDLSNYTEEQLIEELAKRKMSVNGFESPTSLPTTIDPSQLQLHGVTETGRMFNVDAFIASIPDAVPHQGADIPVSPWNSTASHTDTLSRPSGTSISTPTRPFTHQQRDSRPTPISRPLPPGVTSSTNTSPSSNASPSNGRIFSEFYEWIPGEGKRGTFACRACKEKPQEEGKVRKMGMYVATKSSPSTISNRAWEHVRIKHPGWNGVPGAV